MEAAGEDFFSGLKILEPKQTSIQEIYIPSDKVQNIERFIYAIENYEKDRINLRFLLNGPPGTGKTQIIRSILSVIKGKATALITQGGNFPLNDVFEFCSLFEPVLLVIADFDFLITERKEVFNKNKLGAFLQYLDGVEHNNIFLLTSTNDKTLVDEAAARPGRFDLILDIGEIESKNYLALIKRESNDQDIINSPYAAHCNELPQPLGRGFIKKKANGFSHIIS
jgi:SpoVK/Ycf46/Vps4 family AAA+-type ATPase